MTIDDISRDDSTWSTPRHWKQMSTNHRCAIDPVRLRWPALGLAAVGLGCSLEAAYGVLYRSAIDHMLRETMLRDLKYINTTSLSIYRHLYISRDPRTLLWSHFESIEIAQHVYEVTNLDDQWIYWCIVSAVRSASVAFGKCNEPVQWHVPGKRVTAYGVVKKWSVSVCLSVCHMPFIYTNPKQLRKFIFNEKITNKWRNNFGIKKSLWKLM